MPISDNQEPEKKHPWIDAGPVWLYLCGMLFTAYVLMQTSHQLAWQDYISWLLATVLSFSSVFVFIFLEKWLKSVSHLVYWISWGLCFVVLPYVLARWIVYGNFLSMLAGLHSDLKSARLHLLYFATMPTSVVLFCILLANNARGRSDQALGWLRKITIFQVALVIAVLIALLLPLLANRFQASMVLYPGPEMRWDRVWIYICVVPQVFLVYFSNYLFYHFNHHLFFKHVFNRYGLIPYLISLVGMILLLTPVLVTIYTFLPGIEDFGLHPVGLGVAIFSDINYIFPILTTLASFPIIAFVEWNRKKLAIQELQQEKVQAELSLLKQQINPHFFFNTLHNLYALSLEQSPDTPETIMKLAKLMRFVIYQGAKDMVSIQDEVDYLSGYIDLQRIRYRQQVDIKLQSDVDEEIQVPPLLLVNLVENAFKHGIEPSEKDGYIHLHLQVLNGVLKFTCENSVDPEVGFSSPSGMGLKNLRRRLEIRFPGYFSLKTIPQLDSFCAELEINLKK